ncbi:MAG: transcriptional regulator [Desulfuromonas sp.]|nr:MAG: transcriptional regulator [Desulfuromonas sp.]
MTFTAAGPDKNTHLRIAAFPFFTDLSEQGRLLLLGALQPMLIERGTELLDEGAFCQALLLVESGAIRVFKMSPAGREITLYQVAPGESCVLGTSCVVNDLRYPAQAVCTVDTSALAVPAPVFRQLYEEEPAVRSFVMDLFSRRLSDIMVLVEEVAFRRMDERLAAFLLEKGIVSPGVFKPIEMSHEEIASHLGTAREVVSRVLQQFVDDGLVHLERKKVVLLKASDLQLRSGPEK